MTEPAPGLGFAMPILQYNEDGWGPCEISDTFRDMPYQVGVTYIEKNAFINDGGI